MVQRRVIKLKFIPRIKIGQSVIFKQIGNVFSVSRIMLKKIVNIMLSCSDIGVGNIDYSQ